MGAGVSGRQAAAMMLLLEQHGSDVRHLLRTDRWADGDPAEDMGDDEWYDLVATACRIEASAALVACGRGAPAGVVTPR